MIRRHVLEARITKLEEYLKVLKGKLEVRQEAFLADIEQQAVVERFLELAIQAVNDIGSHIIVDQQLGQVESYSDIPRVFLEKGLVDENLADVWIKMCGFRNILAHDYLRLDKLIVYQALQQHQEPFGKLLALFERFL